jgi:molybdate transport system ATP-binding protein
MLDVRFQKTFRSKSGGFALDVAFTTREGFTVLFGPSGSGKTSALRAIAGILVPETGRIQLNGRTYFDSESGTNVPIQQRHVGYVFQEYLLFPHLTAEQNVAYGLRDENAQGRRQHPGELLELMGVTYAAGRYPRELSGGEQQRVALARALASAPALMLLDEPLSAVDASTRARLLEEMIAVQRRSGIPFLYVTHSPADAVRAADEVLIMENGRVIESGPPLEVFNAPRSVAAVRAVGEENILLGEVTEQHAPEGITLVRAGQCRLVTPYNGLPEGARVTLGIRSDDIIVSCERPSRTSARNVLAGTLKEILRDRERVDLVVACGADLKVRVTPQAVEALELRPGTEVYLLIKASACHLLA